MTTWGLKSHWIGARIRPRDIKYVGKWLRLVTDSVQRVNEDYTSRAHKDIFKEMYATTMLATGELQSRARRRRQKTAGGAKFSVGYGQTSNDQAVKQEFEDGKVHRHMRQHFNKIAGFGRENERAKCSRVPVDLYAVTKSYKVNPRARRRALAKAIERRMKTNVRFATNSPSGLVYSPNPRNFAMELSGVTMRYLQAVQK